METRLWKTIFAVLLLLPLCAKATTIDFYTDGTITDGNVFDTVNIWDSANVTMNGGKVYFCNVYESGIFTYNSGDIIGSVLAYDSGLVYSYGTDIGGVDLYQNSQAYLYNGPWGFSCSTVFDSAELHIFGYNLEYHIGAPDWVDGLWPDSRSFEIAIRNSSMGTFKDNVFLHEIPEPSTLSLLGLFALFMRKRGDFSSSGIKRL